MVIRCITLILTIFLQTNFVFAEELQEQGLLEQSFEEISATSKELEASGLVDTKNRIVDVKNEFYESVKLVFQPVQNTEFAAKEIYLNAYETKKNIQLEKNLDYELEVYNIYGKYLGYLINSNLKKNKEVYVSPFYLIKAKKTLPKTALLEPSEEKLTLEKPAPVEEKVEEAETVKEKAVQVTEEPVKKEEVAKDEIATKEELLEESEFKSIDEFIEESKKSVVKKVETTELNGTTITSTTTRIVETSKKIIEEVKPIISKAPEPKEIKFKTSNLSSKAMPFNKKVDDKERKIKIANISDDEVHIEIHSAENVKLGEGWTISNDIYVPEFLDINSQPVSLNSDAMLIITSSKTDKIIRKKADQLNIDERGNYVWFISNDE